MSNEWYIGLFIGMFLGKLIPDLFRYIKGRRR
jgi:hypothetical protein